jgi:hypothetical protein
VLGCLDLEVVSLRRERRKNRGAKSEQVAKESAGVREV